MLVFWFWASGICSILALFVLLGGGSGGALIAVGMSAIPYVVFKIIYCADAKKQRDKIIALLEKNLK